MVDSTPAVRRSHDPGRCVGLVLAAGAGRRMGGPKALLRDPATGIPFVQRAIEDLYAAGMPHVIVVTGAAGAEVNEIVTAAGALAVSCPDWGHGMGASLRAGLAAVSDSTGRGPASRDAGPAGSRRGGHGMTLVGQGPAPGKAGHAGAQPVGRAQTSVTHESEGRPIAALVTLVDLPDVGPTVHARLLHHMADLAARAEAPTARAEVPTARAEVPTARAEVPTARAEVPPARALAETAQAASRTAPARALGAAAGTLGAPPPAGALAAVLARAAYEGRPGHPVLIGRDHWAGAREAAVGDRGARDYFETHPPVLIECGDLATGRDVDTPTDLR